MEKFPRKKIDMPSIGRVTSVVGGGVLLMYGLKRGSRAGTALALLGMELACRGLTGRSAYTCVRDDLRRRQNDGATIPYRKGIRVDEAVTINQSLEPLYQFWRRFDNLPYFMEHLQSVSVIDEKRSHWMAKGPAGRQVEWDAEVVSEVPNEMIGWRSVPGSEINTAGSVHFKPAPGGRGTEVSVELQYLPPGGTLGALFAKLFGEEPQQQIREDLRHLKQIMETGEVPTVSGQPRGRRLVELRTSAQSSENGRNRAESTGGDDLGIASSHVVTA
jgi:uncharacterized membrane protein